MVFELEYSAKKARVPPQGLEPRMPEPKSGVLPITPQGKTRKIYMDLTNFVNEVFNKKTFFQSRNRFLEEISSKR